MKQAARSGARFALIVGENEVNERTVTLKNLSTSEQQSVAFNDVVEAMRR